MLPPGAGHHEEIVLRVDPFLHNRKLLVEDGSRPFQDLGASFWLERSARQKVGKGSGANARVILVGPKLFDFVRWSDDPTDAKTR